MTAFTINTCAEYLTSSQQWLNSFTNLPINVNDWGGYRSCRLSLYHPNEPYHPQVVHEAGAMLPDLGGLARELSGANILATVQLLNCCHHGVHRIKEESGGELQRRTEGG